ncbi:MAG: molybdopterin-synthase adenylyltransferase MoeB [Pseudomonadota bacterium]
MDDRQLIRYSRHILLPQIDLAGQEKLLAGHVLLIGAGGLGSPASLYLASAGVGRLTVCDGDVVDLTNLQRQIVHREATVGVNKAESARRALAEINPDCRVIPVEHRVGPAELADLVAAADVVVDACDNFATRHAVNRACVAARKPLVSGAAIRFAGQIAVFDLRRDDAPCYHCLFPDTSADDGERCATMGVFAPLTGMVGAIQAGEAIRLLAGLDSPLAGQLVLFDAMAMEWQRMKVPRDPGCPVCGGRGT